ncbi:protein SENSITIVITY TO RED LIGHT REDUCED 1 [Oryza brachyantha]|uniref:protein SENSITIVITY TO RED LIGHT REDUCED 1 n=1 Tax=Oryza brachyantha TaxID=4533 RepID=UPI001ADA3903|nr:protein SENSITIVITY TO RED LIGHT REDUCED 1 [Oryza brachyantha]XP_040380490.1 protein SENSITIVITY TO RED LIGHT REDUCED 1 [Oryza brachyantha]XP_040380491.1 protein SENSITIVITY TO RED LIGHT REDUCED 1 [Oryza brachyantha]
MSSSARPMVAAAAPAPAGGDWTVVRRRSRRRGDAARDTASQPDAPPPLPVNPIPWAPSDPSLDPARVSRLLDRARAAISRVAASRLYGRLLLPDSPLRRRLSLFAPTRLSLLGVGSFESSHSSRLQLALAALLRRDLLLPPESSAHAELFDPVLSAAECAAAAALGFSVPDVNDGCRRRADEPTLFYMPHCEASLYDALLAANWEHPSRLRRVCVLGNSFRNYATQAEENRSGPAAKAKHVLAAERFAWEQRVDETGGVDDDDDVFARAFNETSWHFFEVDDAVDLAATVTATAASTGGWR